MPSLAPTSRRLAFGVLAVLAALAAAGYAWVHAPQDVASAGQREAVRVGISLDLGSALLAIAQDQGHFARAGLDVDLQPFPSGARALDALFDGRVDFASTADTPPIVAAFARRDFRIVAAISSAERHQKIAARRDSGIRSPADIRGKRVATQKDSAVHYFLYLFLQNYGLSESDISLSFRKPEDLPKALAHGEIDAFSMREPYISQARSLLPQDALVVFDAPGLYVTTYNLVAMEALTSGRPGTARRMVSALVMAEDFARDRPAESRAIVSRWLGLPEAEVLASWGEIEARVTLDNLLVSGMGNGARWFASHREGGAAAMPAFIDYIHPDALRAVRPGSVTLAGS